MPRVLVVCLGLVVVCLFGAVSAGAAARVIGVEELRSTYLAAGYEVDEAVTWPWQMPIVTSFHVTDRRGGRVLLVEVFGGEADALVEASRKVGGARIENVVLFQSGTREMVNASEVECAPDIVAAAAEDTAGVDGDLVGAVARLLT